MRILHTSDWHLGQHFMGKSRQAEHQALIDWLLVQVDAHAVDAVLIAGDIYDTGSKMGFLAANVAYALDRQDLGPQLRQELERLLDRL